MPGWMNRIGVQEMRTLLFALGFALAVVGTVRLIWPDITMLTKLRSDISAESTGDAERNLSELLKKTEGEIKQLRDSLYSKLHNMPKGQLESLVLGRLQELSWRTGMELISIRPSKGGKVSVFEESRFQIKLRGGYLQIFDWLGRVGRELPFMVLQEYEIKKMPGESDENRLDVELLMVTYGMDG